MILPTDWDYFRQWQIEHYTERLAQATDVKEKMFLREQLHNLKTSNRYE